MLCLAGVCIVFINGGFRAYSWDYEPHNIIRRQRLKLRYIQSSRMHYAVGSDAHCGYNATYHDTDHVDYVAW